jgi:hypothetical protein
VTTDEVETEAVALARRVVLAKPHECESVWGSPLQLDLATSSRLSGPGNRWLVSIPEQSPRGLPAGLDLLVDLDTGECVRTDME